MTPERLRYAVAIEKRKLAARLTAVKRSPVTWTAPASGLTLTDEERAALVAIGKDPDEFAATRGAKNFTDYMQRKKAALTPEHVDAQGRRTPSTPLNDLMQEIEAIVAADDGFLRAVRDGLVPQEEIDAARRGGAKAWGALRRKYADASQGDPSLLGAGAR
jgi:hypothetical protein